MEPEKSQLRAWREEKAEQKSFVASITAWAHGKTIGDADIEFGLQAASVVLGQWGASMVQVAELNLDPQEVAAQVVSSGSHAQQSLSEQGREVCGYAVLVFYQRLIAQNQAALDRAVQRVLLLRTGKTLGAVEALLAAQGQHAPGRAVGPVRVGEIPIEPAGFVDRAPLGELARVVGDGAVGVVCAVTGLRGVGKSQLAAAYARARIAEGWGLVAWVDAETEDSLLAGLARVAEAVGVGDPEGDSAMSAERLREYLQPVTEPGVLVLDNATDPGRVRSLLPAGGVTQVVITTRTGTSPNSGSRSTSTSTPPRRRSRSLEERTGRDDPDGAPCWRRCWAGCRWRWRRPPRSSGAATLSYPDLPAAAGHRPCRDAARPDRRAALHRSTAAALLMAVEQVEQPTPMTVEGEGGPNGLVGWLLRLSRCSPRTGWIAACCIGPVGARSRPRTRLVRARLIRASGCGGWMRRSGGVWAARS